MTLDSINTLPIDLIIKRLVRRHGQQYAEQNNLNIIAKEYQEFWHKAMTRRNLKHLVPSSKAMDDFWHEHILDTKLYAKDCDRILGFFLHHQPNDELNDEIVCHDCWNACGCGSKEID